MGFVSIRLKVPIPDTARALHRRLIRSFPVSYLGGDQRRMAVGGLANKPPPESN